jgi:hypothetical protein
MSIAEALRNIDSLGSIEAELEHLVVSSPLADAAKAEENERKAKALEDQAKDVLNKIEDVPQSNDLLDARSAAAMKGEGRAMLKHITELRLRHAELMARVRSRPEEPSGDQSLDLQAAFKPIQDYYSAKLGKDAVPGNGGKVAFRTSGHEVEFHRTGINVACEDATGLRKLVHGISQKAPGFVAEVVAEAGIDRSKMAQETQDIIKHSEEGTFSRVKALKKDLKDKAKVEKTEKAGAGEKAAEKSMAEKLELE